MKFPNWNNTKELGVADFVSGALSGSDYDRGALEEAAAQATNVSEAFGRLVEILAERGDLTRKDVFKIAKGYVPRDEE